MVSLTTFLLWIPVFLSFVFLWWNKLKLNKLKLKINWPRQINNRSRGLVEKYVFISCPSRGRSWQDPPYSSQQPYWDSSPIRELVGYFQKRPTPFLTPGSSKTSFRHRKSSTFVHRRFANEKLYMITPEKKSWLLRNSTDTLSHRVPHGFICIKTACLLRRLHISL